MKKSKRILVVDENQEALENAHAALTADGYEVVTAKDAEEAEAVVLFAPPALILLEVPRRRVGALALARSLKADPRTRGILILAVTEEAGAEEAKLALEAGSDGTLHRPFDARALPKIVGEYLS